MGKREPTFTGAILNGIALFIIMMLFALIFGGLGELFG